MRPAAATCDLWLRDSGSTLLSQAIDTLICGLVGCWGLVDLAAALQLAAASYVLKIAIAVIDTPLIYWACRRDSRRQA